MIGVVVVAMLLARTARLQEENRRLLRDKVLLKHGFPLHDD